MSNAEPKTINHHCLPILSHDNFADWEMAIISFLTGAPDHIRVIEQCPDSANALVDPARPTAPADEVILWDASECEALAVIMTTASKLHRDVILKHRAERKPVYELWVKICDAHQSRNASLRHQAWMEFFSTRKGADEPYSMYIARKTGL